MRVVCLLYSLACLLAQALALRQTTRAEVVMREKMKNWRLMPRASAAPQGISGCRMERPSVKRSQIAPDHAMFTTFDRFPGRYLPPDEAASFLLGDGTWTSSNGSLSVDYVYKSDIEYFRNMRWGYHDWSISKAMRQHVSSWGAKALAWHIFEGFRDANKVFILSDDYAMRSVDIVRLLNELIAVPDWEEVMYSHHVVPRQTVADVLNVICPSMGPEFCG